MTEVFVLAAPDRDEAHAQCFSSIRASDIGERFTVCMHPEGISKEQHWLETHERAASAKSKLVLVLEDDVLVNRRILHNAETWRWPHHKDYGAGWLYSPGGYAQKDVWYAGPWDWYGTCGVLYRTEALPELIDIAWRRMHDERVPWDLGVAWAAHQHGRRIRVHFPALVEHLNDLPSKIGNPPSPLRTSRGTFKLDWERPDKHAHGIIDEYGRKTV